MPTDLPGACRIGLDEETTLSAIVVLPNFARARRTWIGDAHVAREDVPDLRQFVEREAPQGRADRRHARVCAELEEDSVAVVLLHRGNEVGFNHHHHRTGLDYREPVSVVTDALLGEEHRPGAAATDPKRDDAETRCKDQQSET